MDNKLYLKFCGHTLIELDSFTIERALVIDEEFWTLTNKRGSFLTAEKFGFVPGVVFPSLTMENEYEVLAELYDVFVESIYEDAKVTRVTFTTNPTKPLYLCSK